jgi:phosphotransferase system  glucose/maltose/N-acetylglucosamine-specific IIC component
MSGLIIIFVLIIIPIICQIICIFVNILIGILLFIIWTFLFHQTWAPAKTENDDNEPAPAHEDTNDRARAGKNRLEIYLF